MKKFQTKIIIKKQIIHVKKNCIKNHGHINSITQTNEFNWAHTPKEKKTKAKGRSGLKIRNLHKNMGQFTKSKKIQGLLT